MRHRTTIAVLSTLALLLAACSAGATSEASEDTSAGLLDPREAVGLLTDRPELVVIDVRTADEFASGHLEDAQLLDAQGAAFRSELEALDRDQPYLVYCRSGNRSAQAIAVMEALGFVEVFDAGGLAELAAAGARVVR
jgi:phage shock protein E